MMARRFPFFLSGAVRPLATAALYFCVCTGLFIAFLLVWSLFPGPFIKIPSGSLVVLGSFFLAATMTVFIRKTLYAKKAALARKPGNRASEKKAGYRKRE